MVKEIPTDIKKYKKEDIAGAQEYELINVFWECLGCGVVVSNTPQHDRMHNKTRTVVN